MAFIERAQRFNIPMRVLWRPAGDSEWTDAIGVNASRSGVLFQTDRPAEIGTEIELIFALAWETAPWADVADVICFGRIVRQALGADAYILLAAAIERYSFLRDA